MAIRTVPFVFPVSFALIFASFPSFSEELPSLMWGMNNTGAAQSFLIDHHTSGIIEGVAGEDIHPIGNPSLRRKPVLVAVLDTGVDESHPALSAVIEAPGFNAIDGGTDVRDTHGHGTHVSGIIAGRTDPDGFAGVSSGARILPVRVIRNGPNAPIRPQDLNEDFGSALPETVARGMVHAIHRGARILHLSLAWPATLRSEAMDDAVELARTRGVLIVASAGNDSTRALVQPCLYDHVICVGAHGPDGAFTHFSNHGPMVDLLAPGISILSSWPLSKSPITNAGKVGHEFRNGTSMAAPFVTGALAELISLGVPADEAVSRIFLSSRSTRSESRFRSEIVVAQEPIESRVKFARFGNLDLTRAFELQPSPLVVPAKKAPIELEWNGKSRSLPVNLEFVNRWMEARNVSIRALDKTFHFDRIHSQQRVGIRVNFPVSADSESRPEIPVTISVNGSSIRTFLIPLSLIRVLREDSIPPGATIHSIPEFTPDESMSIRTVIAVPPLTTQGHLFQKDRAEGLLITRISDASSIRSVVLNGVRADQLLNWYALPDGSQYAIFTVPGLNGGKASFLLISLDRDLRWQGETRLDTEITTLPENLRFLPTGDGYSPHFISTGLTPKEDLPPFDPWNPDRKDERRPRIYFLKNGKLRIVVLDEKRTPLFLLGEDLVLSASGSGYFQNYSLHRLKDGRIIETSSISLSAYRMLAGLRETSASISLSGGRSSRTYVFGRSSPGSLRISTMDPRTRSLDRILPRPSLLDSLMGVIGGFEDKDGTSFFVESFYDLLFFPGNGSAPFSSSLQRYSYIPSLIFSKGFFPTDVIDNAGVKRPGVYLPAGTHNDFISEVWIADAEQRRILHPVGLRIRADGNCRAIGNLISGRNMDPSRLVFWCGTNRVEIPITTRE